MRIHFVLILISGALLGVCRGAGFSTDFDSGYDTSQSVAGQNGWAINDATQDLSFFVSYNFTSAAAVGGYYQAPAQGDVRLSHGLSLPLIQTSMGADFAVVPSTLSFPGRDTFGWSVYNALGENLLTIQFEPDTLVQDRLNATWATGTGGFSAAGAAIEYNGPYSLQIAFSSVAGGDAAFSATITGANAVSFDGILPGMGGETIASIGENFIRQSPSGGDNYMLFDNFRVIPEPPAGITLLAAAAFGMLRRRRRLVRICTGLPRQ